MTYMKMMGVSPFPSVYFFMFFRVPRLSQYFRLFWITMPYELPFFYMVFCKHNTDGHAQEDCKVKDGKPTCWGLPVDLAEWIVRLQGRPLPVGSRVITPYIGVIAPGKPIYSATYRGYFTPFLTGSGAHLVASLKIHLCNITWDASYPLPGYKKRSFGSGFGNIQI